MGMARDRSVIILGLDGVSLRDLERIVEWGASPYLASVLKRSYRDSPNVFIPYTAPSWTNIATGVNPGKHNVYDFVKPSPSGELRVTRPEEIMYPRINEMLAMRGLPSVASNLPYIYPPLPKRRYCIAISGWSSPRLRAWPPEIYSHLRGVAEDLGPPKAASLSGLVEEATRILEARLAAELEIAEKYDWRLFFTMIPQTDWVFHNSYKQVMERRMPEFKKLFSVVDGFLRRLSDLASGEPMIILVSDHGFSTVYLSLNINVALMKMGLLKQEAGPLTLRGLFSLILRRISTAMPRLKHALKYPVKTVMQALGMDIGLSRDRVTRPIDYAESAAFMASPYYIYLNSGLSREQRTRVEPLIETLLRNASRLLPFRHYRREEFFHGPFVGNAPDYVVIPGPGHTFSVRLLSDKVVERGYWNIHADPGLVAMYVPGEQGKVYPGLREFDVVPAALYYLGLEVPNDSDGTVPGFLRELLGDDVRFGNYSGVYRGARRAKRLRGRPG